ncbi:hypothetical protein BS50DRAFT_660747 [Corynespora cassiicola Philippines]|uniref:Uncharacterized protein n=1 Tax=Corynespora cassiicola Philippines TaxID=1448308 RepID=A0A2T2P1K1_CORCC|nr:hypothetical protein BS50DRAFT_660747 [Corynespora cassiicola Philippines]
MPSNSEKSSGNNAKEGQEKPIQREADPGAASQAEAPDTTVEASNSDETELSDVEPADAEQVEFNWATCRAYSDALREAVTHFKEVQPRSPTAEETKSFESKLAMIKERDARIMLNFHYSACRLLVAIYERCSNQAESFRKTFISIKVMLAMPEKTPPLISDLETEMTPPTKEDYMIYGGTSDAKYATDVCYEMNQWHYQVVCQARRFYSQWVNQKGKVGPILEGKARENYENILNNGIILVKNAEKEAKRKLGAVNQFRTKAIKTAKEYTKKLAEKQAEELAMEQENTYKGETEANRSSEIPDWGIKTVDPRWRGLQHDRNAVHDQLTDRANKWFDEADAGEFEVTSEQIEEYHADMRRINDNYQQHTRRVVEALICLSYALYRDFVVAVQEFRELVVSYHIMLEDPTKTPVLFRDSVEIPDAVPADPKIYGDTEEAKCIAPKISEARQLCRALLIQARCAYSKWYYENPRPLIREVEHCGQIEPAMVQQLENMSVLEDRYKKILSALNIVFSNDIAMDYIVSCNLDMARE